MKRAINWDSDLDGLMDGYDYCPTLTPRLDAIGNSPIDQTLANEIVLWKVNRYVQFSAATLASLNKLATLGHDQHRQSEATLAKLLSEHGVDLPMASTFLRFRNPRAFQIIDRRAYRALYGKHYPAQTTWSVPRKIELYFQYLDELIRFSRSKNVDYQILDRVLYVFDARENGDL